MSARTLLASTLLALATLVAATPSRVAAQASTTLLPSAGLLADADVLQRSYEALHPGLYRYTDAPGMQVHWDALRRSLDHDQTIGDAYLAFSIFAATIRCGHTYANFSNQPASIRAALFEHANRVPFQFRWLSGRMIVTRNLSSDPSLVPGTEIVSIDGIAASVLLERLMTVARADGSNDAKRRDWLEVKGNESIEAFDVFAPLFFPVIGARQSLVVRSPGDARARPVAVSALDAERRRATGRGSRADDAAPWTLDLSAPGLAILEMPTWAVYRSKWDWHAWLRQVFETLDHEPGRALVIDLRRNEGGLDVGDDLLAHLTDRALTFEEAPAMVRYRRVPDDLTPYLQTWDPLFKDWGDAAIPGDGRFFRLAREDDDGRERVVAPMLPRFAGRVFVLVGPTNSSATFQFAARVRQTGLATLVGRATGGNQRGINGGAFFFLNLPNSGIELDLPLIARFEGETRPDAGIEPDVLVESSVDDIRAGRDPELAVVRRLLASKR